MRRRLVIALLILIAYLIALVYILQQNFEQIISTENALFRQTEIRGLVSNLISSIKNAQLVVFKKQASYIIIDNDLIIDEINKFDGYLSRLKRKYDIEIDPKNCLSCHITIDAQMTKMEQQLLTIEKLVEQCKLNVSFLFTTQDLEIKKIREKEIGEIGDKILTITNRIHHVTTQMLEEMDISIKRTYLKVKQNTLWALGIGVFLNILVIIYLIFTLTSYVDSLMRKMNIIVQNDFIEKIKPDTAGELWPLVETFNKMIEEIENRKAEMQKKNQETVKINFRLEELKLTLEDRVRQRTEEINQVNKELIEQRLKLEKAHSELQVKTKELEEGNQRLKELDKMKSEFIQMANHEIRTPLVTIKGYTELIVNGRIGEVSEKVLNSLKIVSRNIDRLTSIVENIRSYMLLESGRKELRFAEIKVKDFLTDVYNDMLILAEKRQQHLKLELQTEYPKLVCDGGQIYQAFVNLVINGIRYSPDNSTITITAIHSPGADEITFCVKDTGMGIEEKELKNIFLPFYEIKNVREHHSGTIEFNSGGTGLGLAIVKKVVEHHKGRVWAESEGLWKGSSFYFTLPLNRSST